VDERGQAARSEDAGQSGRRARARDLAEHEWSNWVNLDFNINLLGREGRGIVTPGADSTSVQDDLAARVLTLKDPKTGVRMVDAVYKRDDIYTGDFVGNAAQLQVGLADRYRVPWQSTLGGSPPGIVYPNMKKWSGDHGSSDYKSTPGTQISSRPVTAGGHMRISDISPTVLKSFGLPIPSDIDGTQRF
jgi:predicted AlkP superfamily phosphohydrolase/phosphomutase